MYSYNREGGKEVKKPQDNFQDPLLKLMAFNQEEKTGIDKVKDLILSECFDEAILLCNQALAVNKKDYIHMIQKVCAYIKAQKFDNENILPLITELEKAYPQCLKDVDYAEAKYDLFLNTNKFTKAEEFQTTLKSIYGDKNSKYDVCIAKLHIKRGKHHDALQIIEKGLKLNEYDGLLYELKGDILLQCFNQSEEALTQYKYSMQMNKRNPALFQKMATILFNKHYYSETVQYATVALEQIKQSPNLQHLTQQQKYCVLIRGQSLNFLKEYDEAQNNFQRILDFDEKCIQSRMGKAYSCMHKGKSDQAVAIFKKGEELNDKYADYTAYMALAYFMRKDYDNTEIKLKNYYKKCPIPQTQEGSNQNSQPKQIYHLLNYVNFFYLDEPYAKSCMAKAFKDLDISLFKLSDIDLHFIENLSTYEAIKKNLLEYLQNLMLYMFTGIYRWYPEDLYPFLLKHEENQEVQSKLSQIFKRIHSNNKSGVHNTNFKRAVHS